SSGGGHSAGEPLQREYIGQRNPTFRPAYSSSAYKLHRSDDPDVMIYGPSSTRRSNGSTIHLISSPTLSQGMRTIRYE
uniref:Uncharacterized protein n=1 Tax=Plectus sambesii TaxID=2011161 RepID=A0A914WW94_9BILA